VTASWRTEARTFFDARGAARLGDNPTLEDRCFVSGRDPRLWRDSKLYASLIDSIVEAVDVTRESSLLEVGCAAGFLAAGLAPRVGRYVGIDVADSAVALARRLNLDHATFVVGNGEQLPFPPGSFDAAVCYDVLTNIPDVAAAEPIVKAMVAAVRPGGGILLGSILDAAVEGEYARRVAEVSEQLERVHGPAPHQPAQAGSIWGYSFYRRSFVELGESLGLSCEIRNVHADSPYASYRYDVVYRFLSR
jgi:SAM-dependent methyltransferase